MKNACYIFIVILLVSCTSDQSGTIEGNIAESLQFYHNKLKNNPGTDSLNVLLLQLDKMDTVGLEDSVKAEIHYIKFRYLLRVDEKDSAIKQLQQATDYSGKNIDTDREALYHRSLMNAHFYENEFLNVLGTSEKMIDQLPEEDYNNRARTYNYQQRTYVAMQNYEAALEANTNALNMFTLAVDTPNMVVSKISRSGIYFGQGKMAEALNALNEIQIDLDKLSPNINYQYYGNLGAIQFEKKSFDQALAAFNRAEDYIRLISERARKSALANNFVNLSNTYFELGYLDKSDAYIDSVFLLGLNNTAYQNQKEAIKKKLEITVKRNDDVQTVISQLDSVFSYQEKNYDNRIGEELAALRSAFSKEKALEASKKKIELENISFQRNQYLLLTLLLLTILTVMLIVFYNRQRKYKMEKQNFLLQQRLLRSQLNPHFAFNSLNLIKSEIGKSAEKSSRYIVKFSRVLRAIFENSTKDYVLVDDEVTLLSDYLDMQQFRFSDRFDYDIDNRIPEDEEVTIPPMLLQPFVENAIIHGFKGIEDKGSIAISLVLKDGFVACTIEDNGIGFDDRMLRPESSVRLIDKFLQKVTGEGIRIKNKMQGDQNTQGTLIMLNIPFKTAL